MAIAVLIYTCAGEMDIYVDVDFAFQRCQFGDVRTVAVRDVPALMQNNLFLIIRSCIICKICREYGNQ